MPGVTREIARNERGQWLLEINAGRVFRFTDKATAVITKENGDVVEFVSGLGTLTLGTSLGAEASLGFQIDSGLPVRTDLLNWAHLRAEGVDMEERKGTLRRWFPGQLLEEAQVWLRGVTMDARYAFPDAHPGRLTISLERRPTKGRPIPNPQQRVDASTWPVRTGALAVVDPIIEGATYPLILGAPGHVPGGTVGSAVTPALLVERVPASDDDRLLIALGRVQAKAVRLYDLTAGTVDTRTVRTMEDLLGQLVSYVDLVGSTVTAVEGHKYYIGWFDDGGTTFGGGTIDTRTGRMVRSAVDHITFLLRLNGTEVDLGRMESLNPLLRSYKFDVMVNTPRVAFDVLRSEIIKLLPVVGRENPYELVSIKLGWPGAHGHSRQTFEPDTHCGVSRPPAGPAP